MRTDLLFGIWVLPTALDALPDDCRVQLHARLHQRHVAPAQSKSGLTWLPGCPILIGPDGCILHNTAQSSHQARVIKNVPFRLVLQPSKLNSTFCTKLPTRYYDLRQDAPGVHHSQHTSVTRPHGLAGSCYGRSMR